MGDYRYLCFVNESTYLDKSLPLVNTKLIFNNHKLINFIQGF